MSSLLWKKKFKKNLLCLTTVSFPQCCWLKYTGQEFRKYKHNKIIFSICGKSVTLIDDFLIILIDYTSAE